jgi:hypothetical protein
MIPLLIGGGVVALFLLKKWSIIMKIYIILIMSHATI